MILFFISLCAAENLIEKDGPFSDSLTIYAGKYIVDCYGAQGGHGYYLGLNANGGKGAQTKGFLKITGEGTLFYINVGGAGGEGKNENNPGGFNGGGTGGKQLTQSSGGGGGATDIRIDDNNINSRIMVAAGGSGGVGNHEGAPGGKLVGKCYTGNSKLADSTLTTQDLGGDNGIGGKGKDSGIGFPGSGGGGGWKGGVSTNTDATVSVKYKSVAHSGSSYISGYSGCTANDKIVFDDPEMNEGVKEGNGRLVITIEYICSQYCADCTDANTCIKCFDNHYFYDNKCFVSCPAGTREISGFACEKCTDDHCHSCTESKDTCEKCNDGYYLYQGKCYNPCPERTREEGEICEECTVNCLQCPSSKDNCESCEASYHLYEGKCYNSCPDGTREEGNICEKCPDNCLKCLTAKDICELCQTGYQKYEGKCYNPCPEGTREKGDACEKCPDNCKICSISRDVCEQCETNYHLYEGKCYNPCPEGTREEGNTCEKCPNNCKICSTSKDICEQCETNFHLYEDKCYNPCPEGTREEGNTCEKCPENCKTCSISKDVCDECNENSFKYDNNCYSDCSILNANDKYYGPNIDKRTCNTCEDTNCISCSSNYLKCTKCSDSFDLDESTNKCISKLPVDPTIDINDNCEKNKRCNIEKDEDQSFMTIQVSDFISITWNGDGGAIHFINCGINCESTNFINCSSTLGGGGGIYIYLNNEIGELTHITKCTFTQCAAIYGGAIYAFSNLIENNIQITYCTFSDNGIINPTLSKNTELVGGSAVFMSVLKGSVKRCKFYKNSGPGSVKFFNEFSNNENNKNAKNAMNVAMNGKDYLVSISDCEFEIDFSASSSIYYVPSNNRNNDVHLDVVDCLFKGETGKNSRHIDGKLSKYTKDDPKIHIRSCKFQNENDNYLNEYVDDSKNLLSLVDAKQVKRDHDENAVENNNNSIKFTLPIAIASVAIALYVILIIRKKSYTKSIIATDVENVNSVPL